MAEKACVKRLQKEYRALCKEPAPQCVARPSSNNILEWYYVLEGSAGTPFAGGYYFGKIKFPPEYPFKPPGISILTGLLSFMMDTSPTTGSVTTTVAEKQRLAKSSLAFNCKNVKFRNLFPEYVEKYEKEQQLFEKVVPEQKRAEHASEEVRPLLEQRGQSIGEGNKPEPQQDIKNVRRQSFPTWVLVLLVSIFGIVISLPLLQL
uniref:UBC core domain-containing protein n=1 Tax=Daucus carota subsp. sativus TaxID=79200 RepID=A0A166EPQ3_DAUCS